jgi:poly-gamma-glutamate synthesis protein (capsule biosynthesis protein)
VAAANGAYRARGTAGRLKQANDRRRNGNCRNESMDGDPITLFLCGDVMTGRGIDQILPHPSSPELYESWVDSAGEYVAMAEKTNGPIPRPVDFAYIWGDALEELDRTAPAARIVNLETSVTTSDAYTLKGINYRMHPANVPCLTAGKIDCCVLANNHVLDWGRSGLEETLSRLRTAGIGMAGAGFDLAEASTPCAIPYGHATGSGRLLVFAFATSDSGAPCWWSAAEARCGISFLPDLSDETAGHVAKQIHEAKGPADMAVVSVHWGGNWGYEIPRAQRSFAHRLIESGAADVVHGHSAHHRKGIEVYRNKPILYGCGDFINDYEGIGGYEEYRTDLVLMYFVTIDRSARTLVRLEMTPLQTFRFRLRKTGSPDAHWLKEILDREGKPFGTGTTIDACNRLTLEWRGCEP